MEMSAARRLWFRISLIAFGALAAAGAARLVLAW